MNARQMFEALGYEYDEKKYSIIYRANCDKDEDHVSIGFGLLSHTFYAYHYITIDEFKAIQQQLKELHWLDEKAEIKEARNPEVTNLEYYKDEILECCIDDLAVVKGIPKLCSKTDCDDCDFLTIKKDCHEIAKDWLKQPCKKQPCKKQPYKLTKLEKELLECYSDKCSFKLFNSLNVIKKIGYFKGIDDNELIGDILAKSEVVG